MKNYTNQVISLFFVPALIIIAFTTSFLAGQRGFFAFDQSIVFDGGYRVLSGQVPFRDFVVPFAPVVFWMQSFFFRMLGVNYAAYLFHAAIINVFAALLVFSILRGLCFKNNFLAFAGGLITAVWFYPPFGTPWAEQTAFFFALAALWLVLKGSFLGKRRQDSFFSAVSGFCAVFSFLSKQNAGLFIMPLFIILIMIRHFPAWAKIMKDIALFVSGALVAVALFAVWLFIASDFHAFWDCVFVVPAGLGVSRLMSVHALLQKLFVTAPPAMIALRVIVVVAMGAGAVILLISFLRTSRRSTPATQIQPAASLPPARPHFGGQARRHVCQDISFIRRLTRRINTFLCALCAFAVQSLCFSWRWLMFKALTVPAERRIRIVHLVLVFYLLLFQLAFYLSSYNSFSNTFGFIGIVLGLVAAPFVGTHAKCRKTGNAISMVVCAIMLMLGLRVAFARQVHDVFFDTRFSANMQIPSLSPLRWGIPTVIKEKEVSATDIEMLYKYLEASGNQFFIFPDFTVFYGLLGVQSPQPLLWFHKGLTYSAEYKESLDQRVVESLNEHDVKIIVLEKVSFFGTPERLNDFPLLKKFIKKKFEIEKEIGIFTVMRKE